MTIWTPDLEARSGPLYLALADAIAAAIEDGTLADAVKLPPHRDLAHRLGVTIGTISRAYAVAEQRGLVSAEVGRGTFVRRSTRSPERPVAAAPGDLIDLTINQPADRRYQQELARALAELAGRGAELAELMPYVRGLERHRQAGAGWLARGGLAVDPERLIITGGTHQAILIALAALARPGDLVLAEALSYPGLRAILAALHLRADGVGVDEHGMRPEALDAACRSGGARLLFTNPTLHNPTASTLSLERREEIAAIARRHDLIIVEDDVCGLLREAQPPQFARLAPERTIHVTGAAKTLAPGLRIGLLSGPAPLHERLANTSYDLVLAQPALMAEIFALWVGDGTADRLLARQREEAWARQRLAAGILGQDAFTADPCSFHLWLPLPSPWRAADFALVARERGVSVASGQAFALGRGHAPHAVRLSLSSAPDRDRLRHALGVLRTLIDQAPGPARGVI